MSALDLGPRRPARHRRAATGRLAHGRCRSTPYLARGDLFVAPFVRGTGDFVATAALERGSGRPLVSRSPRAVVRTRRCWSRHVHGSLERLGRAPRARFGREATSR